jgi:chitodextrinase
MTASIAAAADLVDPVDPDPIEVDPSPVGTDGVSKDIFITQAEVASLPRTGAAWDRVTAISNTAPGSGALNAAGNTHGATLLTTALRWRADGGGRGKDAVITGCLQALSTYTNPTTDIASPAKQLGAYLLALDVVGASQQLIVPGTGLTLGALLDRLPGYTFLNSVGAAGNTRWPTLIEAARDSGDQTGDYARFCLVAIGRIRGNQTWVEYGSKGYKRNLGDLSVVNDGAGTNPRFRALPYPIPGWRPPLNSFPSTNGAINPIDPDPNLSGANCVAASQGSATPPMTALGVDFTLDAWEALASTGILLVHAGYTDALTWGNSALRRNVASTTHHGGWVMEPATRGARRHLPYLANYLYGSSVPTVAQVGAQQGARMLPDVMPWLLSGSWMSSVAEGPNTPVVVSAPSVTLTAALTGTPLTVTTTASVAAGSAAISTVEFNWGDATATTVLTAAPYTAVHTFATSGPKTVTVRVTAGDGGTATATRTVNVPVAGSTAPTAALTATNATGRTPLTVTFNLAGSASGDGSTLTAEVDFGDNVILVGVPLSGTFTHTYTPETATSWPVTYVASARVTQANGESAIATAAVTVHSALAGADYYEMAGIMENGVLVPVRIAGVVQGGRGVDAIVATTPAGYAALAAPDPTTMYVAVDSGEFPPEGPVQVVDVSGPTAPTALAVTATTPTSASLTWAASTDPESGVSGYEVFRNGTLVTSTSTRTATITGLTASTAYTFTVRAYDVAGNRGAASSPLVVTTPASADTTAPTAPSGLTATSATTTSIALSWAAATDAVGVAGYEVFRGTTLVATTAPGTRTATATGLTPGTSYTFTVRAFDAAGNRGPASAALTTTTAAASDITAPTVAIQDPNAGVTVSGTRTVSGVVGDNIAVSQVAVRVNGVRVGLATVTGTTWTYQWVTTAHENGSVTLTAQATDTAGNATISAGRAVTIANTVTVTPTGDGSWDLGYTGVIPSGAVNFSGTTSARRWVAADLLAHHHRGPVAVRHEHQAGHHPGQRPRGPTDHHQRPGRHERREQLAVVGHQRHLPDDRPRGSHGEVRRRSLVGRGLLPVLQHEVLHHRPARSGRDELAAAPLPPRRERDGERREPGPRPVRVRGGRQPERADRPQPHRELPERARRENGRGLQRPSHRRGPHRPEHHPPLHRTVGGADVQRRDEQRGGEQRRLLLRGALHHRPGDHLEQRAPQQRHRRRRGVDGRVHPHRRQRHPDPRPVAGHGGDGSGRVWAWNGMTDLRGASALYVGTSPVTAVYIGTVLVWPPTEPPPGPDDAYQGYPDAYWSTYTGRGYS